MAGEAIFERDGDVFVPSELARGPWDAAAQHGGAPAALLAQLLDHEPGMLLARLTVELLRPVTIAPLTAATRLLRPGRRVQLAEATLSAAGEPVCRATALRIRRAPGVSPAVPIDRPTPALPAAGETSSEPAFAIEGRRSFAEHGMEVRWAAGSPAPGPATVWFRLRVPLVAGEETSAVARVAAAADFGNGVSAVLDWNRHLFVNPDLTVYLARPPAGEWVCLDAVTQMEPDGIGLAESALFDERGPIGRAAQSLFVDAR